MVTVLQLIFQVSVLYLSVVFLTTFYFYSPYNTLYCMAVLSTYVGKTQPLLLGLKVFLSFFFFLVVA